jgi:hypothetical protein
MHGICVCVFGSCMCYLAMVLLGPLCVCVCLLACLCGYKVEEAVPICPLPVDHFLSPVLENWLVMV